MFYPSLNSALILVLILGLQLHFCDIIYEPCLSGCQIPLQVHNLQVKFLDFATIIMNMLILAYISKLISFWFFSLLYGNFNVRGAYEIDNANTVVGEEEAIWLLKLVLPYLNEFLLKFKALFSGDPATTIKVWFFLLPLTFFLNSFSLYLFFFLQIN